MGRPSRENIVGEPHCYCVHAHCALGQQIFSQGQEAEHFLELLEHLRHCFDLRIYAYAICPDRYYILLQHQERLLDNDQVIQDRWQEWTGSSRILPINKLREKMCSLSSIMQTLSQRYSRSYHSRHQGKGSIWASRYRACLLADDTALLASIAYLRSMQKQAVRMAPILGDDHGPSINPSPLREVATGVITPTDEAPLGTHPPAAEEWPVLLDSFLEGISPDCYDDYRQALEHGWALGRPESLVPSLARMSRPSGRGRSRQLHDLNDDLGLCGLWG